MSKIKNILFLLIFLSVFAVSCSKYNQYAKVETSIIKVDSANVPVDDSASIAMIKPYKDQLDAQMNEIIGTTEEPFMKGTPEGLLGNFVADLSLIMANSHNSETEKVDFCIMNAGGLRTPLPKGAIKKSKVFELMPFENELVVLTLSGEKTYEMFQFIAKKGGIPVSGFSMGIKDTFAVNIKVGDLVFDKIKNYRIVTSDYLANGGDKMAFFKDPIKRVSLNLKVRDAILEYMAEETKKGNKLKSKLDKRIYFEK